MRVFFACVLVVAAVMAAGASGTSAQPPVGQPKGTRHDAAFESCAKACNDCEQVCTSCATHCADLLAQGQKDHQKTLATCRDCATTCAAAARIVAAKGPFADLICTACADACKRCGDACDQFKDDPMMKQCADECRRCEKVCRDMPARTGAKGK